MLPCNRKLLAFILISTLAVNIPGCNAGFLIDSVVNTVDSLAAVVGSVLGLVDDVVSIPLGLTKEAIKTFLKLAVALELKAEAEYDKYLKRVDIFPNASEVRFYLYTNLLNSTERVELPLGNAEAITNAGYNSSLPLVLITHGFMGDSFSEDSSATYLKMGYFSAGFVANVSNVVLVDWAYMTGPKTFRSIENVVSILPAYAIAKYNADIAASVVADFLQFMVQGGFLPNKGLDMHLVGHSLGSHVLGMAAYKYNQRTGDIVDRISGSDPAGPLFNKVPYTERLDSRHATFVDVYHTNRYEFGIINAIGHVDFYINKGGPLQPQCLDPKSGADIILGCSHQCSPRFFSSATKHRNIIGVCIGKRAGKCSHANLTVGEFIQRGSFGQFAVSMPGPLEEF